MASLRPPRATPPSSSIAVLVPDRRAIVLAGDPAAAIRGWARSLGFEGVSTFHLPDARGEGPERPILWSTWGGRWQRDYRDAGWTDVDPRVEATVRELPCVWDGATIVAEGRRQRFLDDAARTGIRSGLAIPIDAPRGRAIVAFDSSTAPVTPGRHRAILGRLGEAMWVAHAIHASRQSAPPSQIALRPRAQRRLSGRERSCLALSARGLSSRDIAEKLGIASRTVDFHIGNVLVKLAALNRREAIAKAIAQGWLAH